MAGQVPMTRPPGYGAQLGDTLMQGSKARGDAVAAELDARASALGDILGNIKGIAEVGGGAIAPDLLIDRFAGGETPIFGNDYAGMADRLRLAGMAADVSRGSGGGGGGGSGKPPSGQWYRVTYPDGTVETKAVPFGETDSLPYHGEVQNGVKFEMIATPPGMEGNGVSVVPPTPTPPNPGGTMGVENGATVQKDGVTYVKRDGVWVPM